MRAPFADAQHDWPARCIQSLAHQRINCVAILSDGVAPVVFQVVHGPGSILSGVLKFMSETARTPGTRFAANVGGNAELQAQRMNVVGERLDPGREALRI